MQKVMLEDGDYTIDHGGNLVLVNSYGHYYGFVKPSFDATRLMLVMRSLKANF